MPPPDALLHAFDASAITYRARFWTEHYEHDELVKDDVRTAIFYSFARHGIEIPWPIEVGYEREWPEPDAATKHRQRETVLNGVDLFSRLSAEQRNEIAAVTHFPSHLPLSCRFSVPKGNHPAQHGGDQLLIDR